MERVVDRDSLCGQIPAGLCLKGVVFRSRGNPTALVMSYDSMHKSSAAGMNGPATLDSNVLLYLEMILLMPLGCK